MIRVLCTRGYAPLKTAYQQAPFFLRDQQLTAVADVPGTVILVPVLLMLNTKPSIFFPEMAVAVAVNESASADEHAIVKFVVTGMAIPQAVPAVFWYVRLSK